MTPKDASRRARVAESLFERSLRDLQVQTDKVFSLLLLLQWAAAVLCAFTISPLTWKGAESSPHAHVFFAVVLGGLLACFPVWLSRVHRGELVTRLVICSAQVMYSALFIHLMGGRIEAHFHIFGSLALMSFYHDYRVFGPAVALVFFDHLIRGVYWPQSVFGVSTPELLRAFEHAGWVLFETTFLVWGVAQSRGQLLGLAELRASLEEERDSLEARVASRTDELAQARDYLGNILDSLDAQIGILDSNGHILSINKAWRDRNAKCHGVGDGSRVGANYLSIADDVWGERRVAAQRLVDGIVAVISGDADRFVSEYRCDNGDSPRWFQARISRFVGGGNAAAVVAHVDVTDRVIATASSLEETKRAAALARILTEAPNEVYLLRQSDLRFVLVSDGATKATGYSRDELLEMSPLDLVPGLTFAECMTLCGQLVGNDVTMLEHQNSHQRKDGSVYPIQVALHAAEYNGEPVFVAFVIDLSEVRRLEGRLAQSQKLESIGQLAAGIAHEINTPMQCVSNNVEFLQECHDKLFGIIDRLIESFNLPARSWDERRSDMQAIIDEARYLRVAAMAPSAIKDAVEASRRIIDIVRAMKAMSHPGTKEFVETDINEILHSAATISRNRWKYVAEVEFDLDDSLPVIPALPAELNQVFLNLIVNAADAIADKHTEGAPLGKITIRTRRQGDAVRVEIDDTGTGVPEEIRARVFDPFFTTKDVGKGTGQGLAIAYDAVVNKHQGTIELLSTLGEGTTFVVCLPTEAPVANQAELAHETAGA